VFVGGALSALMPTQKPNIREQPYAPIRAVNAAVHDLKTGVQLTPGQLLTPNQLSERWQVHPLTLRRWRHEGRIRALQLGRRVRFTREEVERVEKEATV